MRTPEEHRRFTARRHLIPLLVRHCWSPYASRPQQPGFATRYTTTLYLPSSHPSNGIHHTSYRPTATLYLQSCCIMLAVCMPQIPCERRHRPRVAHKGLYSIFSSLLQHSFMVASRFRALWDIPLSASLCAFHPLLSSPALLSSSPHDDIRFSFFFLPFVPVNRSFPDGTAGIWIPPSLYTELSLPRFLLFFFLSLSLSPFFPRVHAFFVPRSTTRRLNTASIRSTIVNWNAIVQKSNVYIYIYIVSQPRKYFSPRISRLVENLCFCVLRSNRKDREEGKSYQIKIIRANSANLPQLSLLEIKSKHRFEIFRGGRDGIPPGTLLFSREHDAATSLRLVICPLNWRKGGRSVGGGRGGIVSFARTGVKKKKKKKNGFLGRRNAHIICWHALSPLEFMDPTTAWFNGRIDWRISRDKRTNQVWLTGIGFYDGRPGTRDN